LLESNLNEFLNSVDQSNGRSQGYIRSVENGGKFMRKIKGVNLGNWLVLEKWMSPDVFNGVEAEDETDLCKNLSKDLLQERLKMHRDSYITQRDFAYIASKGLNTIRIPVPYFIFGDCESFIGCIEYLDKAFNWAEKFGLQILIDLHTAPDSQNGFDNGGLCGVCKWAQDPEKVEFEIKVLERLAERYKDREGLWGIEVLNEPISEAVWNAIDIPSRYPPSDPEYAKGSGAISRSFLEKFYMDAYRRLRKILGEDKVIVFHDHFDLTSWKEFFQNPELKNVVLDTHQYMMIAEMLGWENNIDGYTQFIEKECAAKVAEMQAYVPVICGEWCLFNNAEGLSQYTDEQKRSLYQKLASLQLSAWDKGSGWFYWSYKLHMDTVNRSGWDNWESWDLGYCIDQGWFPSEF
jgi:glucan 1,3-beta-glucosidase